jgi:hypothetical protein
MKRRTWIGVSIGGLCGLSRFWPDSKIDSAGYENAIAVRAQRTLSVYPEAYAIEAARTQINLMKSDEFQASLPKKYKTFSALR